MAGILARKIEMTRVIKGDKFIPVTLLEIPKMQVVGYKTAARDGYSAIVVWVVGKSEAELGKWKTALCVKGFSVVKEFHIEVSDEGQKEVGSEIWFAELEWVELVSLTGTSKGHGFCNRKPTRTHKGKKMHGHYGVDKVTLRDVPLEIVNESAGIIWVRGPVPGARNSLVHIYL